MARLMQCDICRKPTDEIVGKMFFTPTNNANTRNAFHSRYTHHLDVGVCCAGRVLKSFDWTERKSAKEYHATRRRSTVVK